MKPLIALFVAGAFFAAGCSGSKPAESAPQTQPSASRIPDAADTKSTDNAEGSKAGENSADPKREPPFKMPEPPDPKVFEVEKSGKGPWKVARVDGQLLARNIAKAMKSLQGATARSLTTIQMPTGNGQVQTDIKVKSLKMFSIQYPLIGPMPEQCEVVADGKTKAYKGPKGTVDTKKPVGMPGPDADISAAQIAKVWPREFPRLVYRGIVEGKDPWGPLISELTSPRSGFKTEISERTLKYKGMDIKNLRLIAKRTPEAAKKLGPCEMEMVFDSKHFLPVTIRVNSKDAKGAEYNVYWTTHWLFKKTFQVEEFKI